jgi:hypothetical protein
MRLKVGDSVRGGTVTAIEGETATITFADARVETIAVTVLEAELAAEPPAPQPLPFPVNPSMREATDQSLNDRMEAVRLAVSRAYNSGPGEYCYVEAVFDSYAIVRKGGSDGKSPTLWKVAYSLDAAGVVTLTGDPVQVRVTYAPVKEGVRDGQVFGPLLEAGETTPSGKKWSVLVIQEGLSKNRNHYSRKTLKEAVGLYDGARIYLDHEEGGRRFGRSTKDLAGFLKSPEPVLLASGTEADAAPIFAIAATAIVTKRETREELLDAWTEGKSDLFGLSHDVEAEHVAVKTAGGAGYYDVTKIQRVKSVDFVTNPAAGGRVLRLVASDVVSPTLHEDLTMLEQLIAAIKASGRSDLVAKLEALGATPTADAVIGIHQQLVEALRTPPATPPPAPEPAKPAASQVGPTVTIEEAVFVEAQQDARTLFLENSLHGVSLPPAVKNHLRTRFTRAITEATTLATLPSKASITEALKEQVDLYAALVADKVVLPAAGSPAHIEVTKGRRDKVVEAFDDFFGIKREGDKTKLLPNPRAMSFRNLYADITGDREVSGRLSEATRLTESLDSSSFDQILGDSITRRMLAEYAMASQAQWRGTIAEVVSVNDFRTQRRLRFGGYPNLSIVAQGAPYPSLTSPTDEEATYAPAKRGGTEQITREMILNDDVGVIRRIPTRLARAASQTLYEFVFDFMRTNAAIYDATALAAAGHNNNISTTALSATQLVTLRNKIKTMTDMSNSKRLGLSAKYLWVPTELEELAFQITMASRAVPDASLAAQAEPAAPNFVNKIGIEARVVDYWTDTNNYWLTADVSQTPMIEIGFVGGREEPELFLQDAPNQGSMFSNDQLTYKLRHEYGGGVQDYRGFAGGIVA